MQYRKVQCKSHCYQRTSQIQPSTQERPIHGGMPPGVIHRTMTIGSRSNAMPATQATATNTITEADASAPRARPAEDPPRSIPRRKTECSRSTTTRCLFHRVDRSQTPAQKQAKRSRQPLQKLPSACPLIADPFPLLSPSPTTTRHQLIAPLRPNQMGEESTCNTIKVRTATTAEKAKRSTSHNHPYWLRQ